MLYNMVFAKVFKSLLKYISGIRRMRVASPCIGMFLCQRICADYHLFIFWNFLLASFFVNFV